ncbi:GlcG/HbpS family heme-binding protein [Polynucleobacter asymbioticus]|uniref:GlcG/HbpS family heme-binding protein n=1 Tax=Polynucleobacter asymbioticus TaxID=576611 RepID=UPI0008F89310|nr:heme-binding protein [Polynucleobacter asymbioticus]
MTLLSLAQANLIADKALEKAESLGFQPQTVAVLDAGGHIKVIKRSDGASLLRPEIAFGKAWGVLGMGFGGRDLAKRAEQAPAFFTALNAISNGRMVPVAGGVLIKDAQNEIIGSVGISGDTSDNDEVCAVAGVIAAGLVPDTGA